MPWVGKFFQRSTVGTIYRCIVLSDAIPLWQQKLGEVLVGRTGTQYHKGGMLGEPEIEWLPEAQHGHTEAHSGTSGATSLSDSGAGPSQGPVTADSQ